LAQHLLSLVGQIPERHCGELFLQLRATVLNWRQWIAIWGAEDTNSILVNGDYTDQLLLQVEARLRSLPPEDVVTLCAATGLPWPFEAVEVGVVYPTISQQPSQAAEPPPTVSPKMSPPPKVKLIQYQPGEPGHYKLPQLKKIIETQDRLPTDAEVEQARQEEIKRLETLIAHQRKAIDDKMGELKQQLADGTYPYETVWGPEPNSSKDNEVNNNNNNSSVDSNEGDDEDFEVYLNKEELDSDGDIHMVRY